MLLVEHKTLVGQVHGAFFAVEAVVVPGLSFIGHHTGAFTKPCGENKREQKGTAEWIQVTAPSRQGQHVPCSQCPHPAPTAPCIVPHTVTTLPRSPGPERVPEFHYGHPGITDPHIQMPLLLPCATQRPPSITSFFDLAPGHDIRVATRRRTWAAHGMFTYRASRSC